MKNYIPKEKETPQRPAHLRVISERGQPTDYSVQDDDTLMLAYQQGSEEAFEELVHRYQRSIFSYVFRMLQNRHIAEEVTQEVFLALVRNSDRYAPQGKFSSYLFAIASNKIYKEWEQRRRRPRFFSLSFWNNDNASSDGGLSPLDVLDDKNACVEKACERSEISKAINDALKHLPTHYREAFVLRRFQDLSYDEIAEILDCPVGTIKSRVARAEKGLRPYLEKFREYLD
jgi:RNA polymerase sigma-70 factor (ECF subfamily)